MGGEGVQVGVGLGHLTLGEVVHAPEGGPVLVHPAVDHGGVGFRVQRHHQRAYTLVDPDPEAGTFSLEFALHEGCASDWARAAKPGDTVEATVQGTGFEHPSPAPSHFFAVGDPASLPAINSLLDALGSAPATVWFEGGGEDLPFRTDPDRHELRHVPRRDSGAQLVDRVKTDLPGLLQGASDPYVWIACDTATTRTLAAYVRKELGLPKQRVHALGYWRAS
ncbi:siderophore-interacting protein [Streptomyces sp. NPDC057099]|uniref:siderophore-interacting protein n=1 Tax=Streptomyces sp. NPDC057099 TaxID=3346019 RepID=UPI00362BB8A7